MLTGTLAFDPPATSASPAGDYPVTPLGQSSGNYSISYVDGMLRVNPSTALNNALANSITTSTPTHNDGTLIDPRLPRDQDGNTPQVQGPGGPGIGGLAGLNLIIIDNGIRLPPGM